MAARQIIAGALVDALAEQPWYRRYANTITAFASATVTLGTWAAATWTDLPPAAATALGVLVMVAGVVAQRATRNGLTPRGNADVELALRGVQLERMSVGVAAKLDEILRLVEPLKLAVQVAPGLAEKVTAADEAHATARLRAMEGWGWSRPDPDAVAALGRHTAVPADEDDTERTDRPAGTDSWGRP